MALKLKNRWTYKGDDWWEWEAFLDDAGTGDLKDIAYVDYVLHPTFPDPKRRVEDPANGFGLRTGGWGTFKLKAFVHRKNGQKFRLEHEIELEYEPKKGISN